MSRLGFASALCCREDFGNLRWIDRRGHVAVDDLQFSAGGVVRNRCYLGFDNFAAVEADPDAGAYAVVHAASILAPLSEYGALPARRPMAMDCSQETGLGAAGSGQV